jgi:hypothetical protein
LARLDYLPFAFSAQHAHSCASTGDTKSTSLLMLISLSSARSAVSPPLVDAVALFG